MNTSSQLDDELTEVLYTESSETDASAQSAEDAIVPSSPVDETSVSAMPDRLFDSRLLEDMGIVSADLDRRLAPLLELRCIQTSNRVINLLQMTREYNTAPAKSDIKTAKEQIDAHNADRSFLEKILDDIRAIRDGALQTGTILAPKKRRFRKAKEHEETHELSKRVLINKKLDHYHPTNKDASVNFAYADGQKMAIVPGNMNWLKGDGKYMSDKRILEVVSSVNELIWKLDLAVKNIQTQTLPD